VDDGAPQNILAVADVRRGQLCWAFYENGVLTRGPLTQDQEAAYAEFKHLPPHNQVQDLPIDGGVLGSLGYQKQPDHHPAIALYSRPPDAKLPGGKTLPPS